MRYLNYYLRITTSVFVALIIILLVSSPEVIGLEKYNNMNYDNLQFKDIIVSSMHSGANRTIGISTTKNKDAALTTHSTHLNEEPVKPNYWMNVTFPTQIVYKTDTTNSHHSFISKKYEIKNDSQHPIRVELHDFLILSASKGSDVDDVKKMHKLLALKTSSVSKNLIVDGVLANDLRGTELMTLGSDKTQITFPAPVVDEFEFTGDTSESFDPSSMKQLTSKLTLNFVPLNDDGTSSVVAYQVEMDSNNNINEIEQGESRSFKAFVHQLVNGTVIDEAPVQNLEWSVKGATNTTNTKIDNTGKLSIALDEKATSLEISAKSVTYDVEASFDINVVDNTIDFISKQWDIIKDLGQGNVLIAMRGKIGDNCKFNNYSQFFSSNEDNLDGFSNSLVKSIVDKWYEDNIKGKSEEHIVQPVILPNATLKDMKILGGWTSNTIGNSLSGFLTINQPNAYPTIVDSNGIKQAFLMSGSDISNGQGDQGNLTNKAFSHKDKLATLGIIGSWLRSPGSLYNFAAHLSSAIPNVSYSYVMNTSAVVPSIVIHVDDNGNPTPDKTTLNIKNSTLYVGDTWSASDNFVNATDDKGHTVDFSKIKVTGTLDTTTASEYDVTYSYGAKSVVAHITVLIRTPNNNENDTNLFAE